MSEIKASTQAGELQINNSKDSKELENLKSYLQGTNSLRTNEIQPLQSHGSKLVDLKKNNN